MIPFFKTKKRNRRAAEREHVLDVRLRATQSRAARLRVAGVSLGALLAVATIALIGWRGGKFLLDRLVYENDAFAIQQIEVRTDGVLTTEIIRRWAGVRSGDNLMALDLMRVKRALEEQPPVQFVAIERMLPHTLKVTVTERDPVAQAMVSQTMPDGHVEQAIFDFDADGFPMRPLDPSWRTAPPAPNETLPILVGVAASDVAPGRQIESAQIRAALRLIAEFDHSPMMGFADLQRVNVALPEILQATTSQGAQITFSLNHFDTQLRRWRLIYDQYQRWGRAITSADLSISNNVPVRWAALNGVPPPAPKPAAPHRTKRKNV
ncbi:MAG TPA: FtsQ-type POTRA domain-containing protein [Verrucomicrobiae bacterium]|jgi:cell division septal protein FtsQ|nr:FtsQ-type POTRA domain-containing protein [Verrucomicrobiae bacterium]